MGDAHSTVGRIRRGSDGPRATTRGWYIPRLHPARLAGSAAVDTGDLSSGTIGRAHGHPVHESMGTSTERCSISTRDECRLHWTNGLGSTQYGCNQLD